VSRVLDEVGRRRQRIARAEERVRLHELEGGSMP
jgi:hypothetical protein